jgi:phosphoribosylaminoimidazole-succinocarboxamide synthase
MVAGATAGAGAAGVMADLRMPAGVADTEAGAAEAGAADTVAAAATASVEPDRAVARQSALAPHLANILPDATIPELPNHYRGKVRDNYDLPDGGRIIIATDRLSAFDRIVTAIPCKGQVLTQIARFWFEATCEICPNHVIAYPDPNVVVCWRLDILPIEIVVRDYLTGTTGTSIWPMYKSGRREIYGIRFPDGLRENQKLPQTIITPTTKAVEGQHDEPVTADEILSRGLLTREQWNSVSQSALALFAHGRSIAAERGLILVDTKYEFGLNRSGQIILADEIHTPDSSRYWIRDSYDRRFAAGEPPETLDKDFLRRWVTARCDPYRDPIPPIPREIILETARLYIDAYETITGEPFDLPPPELPIIDRIRANLAEYF